MKRIIIIGVLFIAVISCKKNDLEGLDEFQVYLSNSRENIQDTAVLTVGDTAKFSILGNPDIISFYSGESGKKYENATRDFVASSISSLNFTSLGTNLSAAHPNSLSFLISKDYNGIGDSLSVKTANWDDITSRAILSTGTSIGSGIIDISDYRNFDTVYVAFRYNSNIANTSSQPTWTISSFNFNNFSLPDSVNHNIRQISNTGWQVVDPFNSNNKWVVTANSLRLTGGAVGAQANESWLITKLSLKSVNPDLGTPIKKIDERVSTFTYRFSKKGVYKVSFLASNQRYNVKSEKLKQIIVKVQ